MPQYPHKLMHLSGNFLGGICACFVSAVIKIQPIRISFLAWCSGFLFQVPVGAEAAPVYYNTLLNNTAIHRGMVGQFGAPKQCCIAICS